MHTEREKKNKERETDRESEKQRGEIEKEKGRALSKKTVVGERVKMRNRDRMTISREEKIIYRTYLDRDRVRDRDKVTQKEKERHTQRKT